MSTFDGGVVDQVLQIKTNSWHLEELRKQLASPIGVVPFIGAGLSRPLGFSLWSDFLIREADGGSLESRVRELLAATKYEEAADLICIERHATRFEDAVRREFGKTVANVSDSGPAVVPLLAKGPVITTNFDRVLESAFAEAQRPFESVARGTEVSVANNALAQNKPVLVKLHGDWEASEGRVLTLQQYQDAYGRDTGVSLDKPLPRLLRRVMENRPLLFVGCSLAADRTLGVLKAVAHDWPEIRHYAIVPLPLGEDAWLTRDRQLAEWGIRPIYYPADSHGWVREILAYLASNASTQPFRPSAPSTVASGLQAEINELREAGYPDSISNLAMAGRSPNGVAFSAEVQGQRVFIKFTKLDRCDLAALRKLQASPPIAASYGRVSARVFTPLWVGASQQHGIEVLSYFHGIRLDHAVHKSPSGVSHDLLADLFECLVGCVFGMSDQGILHRDLAPENILIASHFNRVHVAIIDCSFATVAGASGRSPVCNANYTAPEQRERRESLASELFAVGGILFFLANKKPADPSMPDVFEDGLARVNLGLYSWAADSGRTRGGALVRALLSENPEDRPSRRWELRLDTNSRTAEMGPLVGVLELRDDIVLVGANAYAVVARNASRIQSFLDQNGIVNRQIVAYLRDLGVSVQPEHLDVAAHWSL